MALDEKIHIRRAKPIDARYLTDIAFRSKQSNGYDDEFMRACAKELTVSESDLENDEYWVAEQNVLCGFAGFTVSDAPGVAQLHSFFIDPKWQKKGIGKRLWFKVLQSAIAQDVKVIQLDSDPAAVEFYESLGFKFVTKVPSGSIKGRLIPRMEILL